MPPGTGAASVGGVERALDAGLCLGLDFARKGGAGRVGAPVYTAGG